MVEVVSKSDQRLHFGLYGVGKPNETPILLGISCAQTTDGILGITLDPANTRFPKSVTIRPPDGSRLTRYAELFIPVGEQLSMIIEGESYLLIKIVEVVFPEHDCETPWTRLLIHLPIIEGWKITYWPDIVVQ